jgi:uncharacterized membrane protein YgdD (TMEM256/DUF423 family)
MISVAVRGYTMHMNLIRISAITGFLAVTFGAFGAHGLEKILPSETAAQQLKWWHTAVEYHLAHAVAMLAIALAAPRHVWASRLMLGGIVLFSGSLYVMGATGIRWLGAVTPIGGLLLLAGWIALAWQKPGDTERAGG